MPSTSTIRLYAAGSLKAALTDVAQVYKAGSGHDVDGRYGPSGLLKDEIAGGARADVFASANMTHPQALHAAGIAGPVIRFARNELCALVAPGLNVTSAGLLDRMLDPATKLGTSTPNADPSGDYAFAAFARAETIRPGARAMLEAKALQLTGQASSATPPDGRVVYGWHIAEGRADIFLTYRTNALAARKQDAQLQMITLPENLRIGADYGLTVIAGARPAAQTFADYILSPEAREILASRGFSAGG